MIRGPSTSVDTVLGRDVEDRTGSPDEHLAILVGAGPDQATAGFVVALEGNIRDGALADATPDPVRLAGWPTTPLVEAVRAMAS
jgi:NAD(P)H dehydrogenase (quinone)